MNAIQRLASLSLTRAQRWKGFRESFDAAVGTTQHPVTRAHAAVAIGQLIPFKLSTVRPAGDRH